MANTKPDYAEVSPYMLLREVPQLALNEIPECLAGYCAASGMKAWELLEVAVFFFFRQLLMLDTVRLGNEALFQHDPEGVVIVNSDPYPFAMIYECKSRSELYKMTADDILRYRDYIRLQRYRIKERKNCELTHFLIVSSGFRGDIELRLKTIDGEGVVMSLVPAQILGMACQILGELEYPDIRLLNLRELFVRGVVDLSCLGNCFGEQLLEESEEFLDGGSE